MTVSVTLRSTKGSPLTNVEMDANFSALAAGVNSALATSTAAAPATSSSLGGVIVGSGLSITTGGVLSVSASTGTTYTLPAATASTLGGVKVGAGLYVDGSGTISVSSTSSYTLPPATSTALGGVKVGSGLSVDGSGMLSANAYVLPPASSTVIGGVKVGAGLTAATDGTVSIAGLRILAAVNFKANGTARKAFNIAAVTRNSAGTYTVTFTTPMPDANYLVIGTIGTDWDMASTVAWDNNFVYGSNSGSPSANKTVNSVVVTSWESYGAGREDPSSVSMIVLG